MEQSRKNYTFVLMSLIAAIVFVTYNVILFVICGFGDHGGSFWISFSFVVVAFIAFAVSGLLVQNATKRDENWVLGYSVLKYSAIYLAAEILISVAFVALDYVDCPWAVPLIVQLLLLAAYCVVVIVCFMGKVIADDVGGRAAQKTTYIRNLTVEVEMIAENATGTKVKTAYLRLAEQFRFCDPMSTKALEDLDSRIASSVALAKGMTEQEDLLAQCREISKLLTERNKRCKALK